VIASIWAESAASNWPVGAGAAGGLAHLDGAFDVLGFEGAWDGLRVSTPGTAHAMMAWATTFNPDYGRRDEARYDTWETLPRPGTAAPRVATLYLFFRYRNRASPPPGADDHIAHDLVLLRWLESTAADAALAADCNGSRTFTVMRPRGWAIVPTHYLRRPRGAIPCGSGTALRGALWVWDE